MDETGIWRLFLATGLPQAYLALRGLEEQRDLAAREPAVTAFWTGGELEQERRRI